MLKTRNRLFLRGLIAVAVAASAPQAFAKVIVCDDDLRTPIVSSADPLVRSNQDLLVVGSRAEQSVGSISALLAIEPAGMSGELTPERSSKEVELVIGVEAHSVPSGMAPCSTSLSQMTGSSGAGALVRTAVEVLDQNGLAGTLPVESRLIRPSGPKNRWFRPPRNWL